MTHEPDPAAVFLGPQADPIVAAQVVAAGGRLVERPEDAAVLVWLSTDPATIDGYVRDGMRWVQLPQAGINRWLSSGIVDDRRVWTSAAGAFGPVVAERALGLLLAGTAALQEHARMTSWTRRRGTTLRGSTVLVVGTGAIGRHVAPLLQAFGADPVGMNRTGAAVEGFVEVEPFSAWPGACADVDHVVLAAPATPATFGMVDAAALRAMRPSGVLVNVARGELVDTDALVAALAGGEIAAACLDVTSPEPLPDGHPLWREPRALITSHTANPPRLRVEALAAHIGANVRRWLAGEALASVIDVDAGY